VEDLLKVVMIYQTTHLIPFYMVTEELKPQVEQMGLISTKYLVSLPTQKFDAYMEQLGHKNLRKRSRFSLRDGDLPKKVRTALEQTFDTQLTRLLLHYLDAESHSDSDQKSHIARHIDTRLNFAVLIGCAIYANSAECMNTNTLEAAINAGLAEGSSDLGTEDCSFDYYGFVLKSELLHQC